MPSRLSKSARSAFYPILVYPRYAKKALALAIDISLCVISVWIASSLRLGYFVELSQGIWMAMFLSVALLLPVFHALRIYRAIFRYSGWASMLEIARGMAIYTVLYAGMLTGFGIDQVPRTVGLIQPLILLFLIAGARTFGRYWIAMLQRHEPRRMNVPCALIYGAGRAGSQLASALENGNDIRIVGFVDDDVNLHGHFLNGRPIYSCTDLSWVIRKKSISHVLLAIPSASRKRRHEILDSIKGFHVKVLTLPSFADLADGKVTISDLRDLDVEDLLGREPVPPVEPLMRHNTTGKVVLVTGAGGSIGSELCRQLLRYAPERVLLVELSEYALYAIHSEMETLSRGLAVPLLGSVLDETRMRNIIQQWRPDVIYHAAAYKHVPLVESNFVEGLKNNVFGTYTVLKVAAECGVPNFIFISTDKAVRPTSIMGASKRLAELCVQALNAHIKSKGTITQRLSIVRFGNVLDSSGSVIPLFVKQIRSGGPITLTHSDVRRYFMTIPEAAQLVIQAGALAEGGEVFVLDMGEQIKIADLARRITELSGLSLRDEDNPDGDIQIVVTGLRPGEKLYEELLLGEGLRKTMHGKILMAHDPYVPWGRLELNLKLLKDYLNAGEKDLILGVLTELVVGYFPDNSLTDPTLQNGRRNSSRQPVGEVGAVQ